MARPTMNMFELTAVAQIREPIWKMATKTRKVGLIENTEKIFPPRGCNEQTAKRYAAPYQPMSAVLWKRFVIEGTAC